MTTDSFKLVRQFANGAAYAEVGVVVDEVAEPTFAVLVADAVPEYHREAAVVGVRYAHAHWLRGQRPGVGSIKVTVSIVHHTAVDTTDLAVLFAAYQATCRALHIEPDPKVVLRPDSIFEFPQVAGR